MFILDYEDKEEIKVETGFATLDDAKKRAREISQDTVDEFGDPVTVYVMPNDRSWAVFYDNASGTWLNQ